MLSHSCSKAFQSKLYQHVGKIAPVERSLAPEHVPSNPIQYRMIFACPSFAVNQTESHGQQSLITYLQHGTN